MAKRENGDGTIRTVKGANGTKYYAYAPARYEYVGGIRKCVREPLGVFRKKADAKDALSEYARHPTSKYNYTLQMVFDAWKAEAYPDIGKSTQDGYSAAWIQICNASPELPGKRFKDIVTSDMRAVLDFWMEPHQIETVAKDGSRRMKKTGPLSMSSMTKIKAVFTQLFRYAMSNNITDRNYASLVKIPKGAEAGSIRAMTAEEFSILEKSYQKVPGGEAVLALCYLGFRVSEFCQLSSASYNPNTHTLTGGLKTEAGKDRVVPVHSKIRPIVERWAADGTDPLYADKKGNYYNKDSFTANVWKPAIEALGLPSDLTPHSARHTCATRLAAAGARPEDIKEILGHADYSITANTYINQDTATLTKAMELVK